MFHVKHPPYSIIKNAEGVFTFGVWRMTYDV